MAEALDNLATSTAITFKMEGSLMMKIPNNTKRVSLMKSSILNLLIALNLVGVSTEIKMSIAHAVAFQALDNCTVINRKLGKVLLNCPIYCKGFIKDLEEFNVPLRCNVSQKNLQRQFVTKDKDIGYFSFSGKLLICDYGSANSVLNPPTGFTEFPCMESLVFRKELLREKKESMRDAPRKDVVHLPALPVDPPGFKTKSGIRRLCSMFSKRCANPEGVLETENEEEVTEV